MDDIVSKLEQEIKQLTDELNETKEHLKKYTIPTRSTVYNYFMTYQTFYKR